MNGDEAMIELRMFISEKTISNETKKLKFNINVDIIRKKRFTYW